jgi:guanosine-3',5'-bis(diphosphate) 3'-pyrophosphohydrolase
MSLLKSDFDMFSENVYCFTPSGDVKNLPNGSTPIDFAYSIHSAVGNKMVGARVNGKLVTIDYVLQNGDRVEILTSQNSKGPSRDWLNIVKSTQAKSKINQWFKNELKEDNIIKGKEMILQYCKTKGISLSGIMKSEYMAVIMRKYGFKDWDSVNAAIGHGGLKEGQVVNKLVEEYEKTHKKELSDSEVLENVTESKEKIRVVKSKGGIVVKGIHDVAVRFSKCCSPVPGDEIIGFITRGRGVSIHRTDCVNIINLTDAERVRLIDAEWQQAEQTSDNEMYTAEIMIFANNRTGILVDISKIFNETKTDVTSMNCRTSKQGTASISIAFEIHGRDELNRIIDKLRRVESVLDIERTTG